jgi:hypothetical protein
MAMLGLDALHDIVEKRSPSQKRAERLAQLGQLSRPQQGIVIAVIPGIQELISR